VGQMQGQYQNESATLCSSLVVLWLGNIGKAELSLDIYISLSLKNTNNHNIDRLSFQILISTFSFLT